MDVTEIGTMLAGSEDVIRWFGGWPSFHDAEVVSLAMARSGESRLRVYPCYPEKPATVDFILDEITDVELADFSKQNVISSLHVERVKDQTNEWAVRLTLSPCYGLVGRIDAKRIRVELFPGKSPDGVSQW